MTDGLIIISSERTKKQDQNLRKLTQHFGVRSLVLDCDFEGHIQGDSGDNDRKPTVVAMSARVMDMIAKAPDFSGIQNHSFLNQVRFLLLYDFQPDSLLEDTLKCVSSGAIRSVSRFNTNDHNYEVSSNFKDVVHELGGLSIGPIDRAIDFGFECPSGARSFDEVISIDKNPFFVRLKRNDLTCFLVASTEIIDLDEEWAKAIGIHSYFSRLVPYAMFVKSAFGEYCWHNHRRYANFIIDDPLLKKKYGMLDFFRLSRLLKDKQFKATIAFIPWNYRRTSRASALFFRQHQDELGLCVHGCDHSAGEFGSANRRELAGKAGLALERMDRHEKRTGVRYDKVMVFPQGVFSSVALEGLQINGYLAAVNSSIQPIDAVSLKANDYLDIAWTSINGFPVFQRRYPSNLSGILLDLFLGKPALIVEHHSYFKNDDSMIGEFIGRVKAACADIEWASLSEILRHTHLMKKVDERTYCCHIFTDEAVIQNDSDTDKMLIMTKRQDRQTEVGGVFSDGKRLEHFQDNGVLRFSVRLGPRQSARIIIKRQNAAVHGWSAPLWELPRILCRRLLSEFRDEHLRNHEGLLDVAHKLNRHLPTTTRKRDENHGRAQG